MTTSKLNIKENDKYKILMDFEVISYPITKYCLIDYNTLVVPYAFSMSIVGFEKDVKVFVAD
jgi:hypothetical protein